jgi:hypothetical protein
MLILIAAILLLGCATREDVQKRVAAMEPKALEAARERAQSDLACGTIRAELVDRQVGELDRLQGLHRVVYRIETTGCGRKSVYAVACIDKSVCSAMSDSGLVERQ